MQPVIAVRIDKLASGVRVSGFVNRGPNRARVWALDLPSKEKTLVLDAVKAAEAKRLGTSTP